MTRHFAYNAFGDQTESWFVGADKRIQLTKTGYDRVGRVTGTSFWLGPVNGGLAFDSGRGIHLPANTGKVWETTTRHDGAGRVVATTDRFGHTTETSYDARGNVSQTRSEMKNEHGDTVFVLTRTAHDANGRAIASTDPFLEGDEANARVTHTLHDPAGRVTETRRLKNVTFAAVTAAGGSLGFTLETDYAASAILSRSLTHYDAQGRVQETQTTEGLVTRFAYDAAGRQEAVTIDPENAFGLLATTRYTYDALGRQETVTDPMGRVTRFKYDDLGRVRATTAEGNDADNRTDVTTQTIYDARGRRAAEIDGLGRRTEFTYDDAGRLLSVSLPGVDDALTAEKTLIRPTWTYGYDAFGNRTSIEDSMGRVTAFGFDGQNRQTSRTLPLGVDSTGIDGDFTESMVYHDQASDGPLFGLLKSSTDFEGNTVTYGYDGFGRQTSVTYANADGETPPHDDHHLRRPRPPGGDD